ncbi:MAG: hypothetical protein KA419_14160 [Acidobacteria bacterium]|nr:hypothetical protein [Acidobacteriota bacterium]
MKRFWILPALAVFAVSTLRAEWLQMRQAHRSSDPRPSVEVLVDDVSGVTLDIGIWGAERKTRETHGQRFAELEVPGAGKSSVPGLPQLPVIRRLVEVPAGASVTVDAEVLESIALSLPGEGVFEDLLPAQLPREKVPGAEKPFQRDASVYGTDAFHPAAFATCSAPLVVRGRNLVLVEFHPIRYNPVRREVQAATRALLHLRFAGGDRAYGDAEAALRRSASFERRLASSVVNYRPAVNPAGALSASSLDGILFIVGNNYAANTALAAYVADRRAEGFRVETVPMSGIGASDMDVRNYIRSQYLSWSNPGLSYVVIVGDVADVPAHTGSGGSGTQPTDRFYACVDPENYEADILAPDLVVSRISVASTAELNNYLAKAQKYLDAAFSDFGWMKRLCFIATDDSGNYPTAEGTHNYVIDTFTSGLGYTGAYPANPQAGGDKLYAITYNADTADCLTAINGGRAVINYSGHGGTTSWSGPSFTVSNINSITHPDAIPFVIGNACVTGKFSVAKCFGESWMVAPTGGILYWGASNNSYWDEDDILERRMWDGIFQQHLDRIGDFCAYAMEQLILAYGTGSSSYYYAEIYNLFGDATLNLYSDPCQALAPTYPATVPVGASSLAFHVGTAKGNVAGASVCVQGDGNVRQAGVTDAAGNLTLTLNPVPTVPGTLSVVISAPNVVRYEGTVQVMVTSGPYLTRESYELTTNGTTPTQPFPGRSIVMPVTLRNVGILPAAGITATLTSTSPHVAVTQAQAVYPDIPVGGTARSTSHFAFDISAEAADGETLPLNIAWSSGTSSGTLAISLTVVSPRLEYVSMAVNDLSAGCDQDGIADVGETAAVTVTVRNTGGCSATGVRVSIASPGSSSSGGVNVGTLAPGATGHAQLTLTPGKTLDCPVTAGVVTVTLRCNELSTPPQATAELVMNADVVQGNTVCQRRNCAGEDSYGDVNADGIADGLDEALYAQYFAGAVEGFACPWKFVDLNGDGEVDPIDLVILYHYVVGNISQLPVE